MSSPRKKKSSHSSRWDDIAKQPEAKWVKVYNQSDDFDTKGHNILVSPRFTKDFDHFMDEVNEKLKPPIVPLRKIYTSAGGTEVRTLSALKPHQEYAASPLRFKKTGSKRASRKNSKKSSASSEGYHSSDDHKGNGRMTLMERQATYAKKRSESEPPTPSREKAASPLFKNTYKKGGIKPRYLDPSPTRSQPQKKVEDKPSSPVKKAKKRSNKVASKKAENSTNKGKKALPREKTPPCKKRIAFRGEYIFVTDEESDDSGKDSVDLKKDRGKNSDSNNSDSDNQVNKAPKKGASKAKKGGKTKKISKYSKKVGANDNQLKTTAAVTAKRDSKTGSLKSSALSTASSRRSRLSTRDGNLLVI